MDREAFDKRVDQHYEKVQQYIECLTSARTIFHGTAQAYEEAINALIKSGAIRINKSGNIVAGWYNFGGQYHERFSTDDKKRVGLAGGVTSIGAALGAPFAAWTLVGAFGTASTGAAISGLSGAAASGATAAWFGGGSLATGGLGMAAAPFVLTGIGAVAGLAVLGAAVTITRVVNRNRSQKEMDDAVRKMDIAERRMEANCKWISKHRDDASQITKHLIKTTAILEYFHELNNLSSYVKEDKQGQDRVFIGVIENEPVKSCSSEKDKSCHAKHDHCDCVPNIEGALSEAVKLVQKVDEGLPYERIYLERPSAVTHSRVYSERRRLHIEWDDPDKGESEIYRYRVKYNKDGIFSESNKKLTDKSEITLKGLNRSSGYEYTISARNPIGWGEESEEFKANTT